MGLKIGSFLGGLARTATSLIPGPAGALARGVINMVAPRAPSGTSLVPGSQLPVLTQATVGTQVQVGPQFNLAFGGGAAGQSMFSPGGGGNQLMPMGGGGSCGFKGYHTNKTLVRAAVMQQNRGGLTPGMQRAVSQVVQQCVRNRSMNVMNAHAARKAVRRVKGAMKMLRRIERTLPKGRSAARGRKR